MTAVFFNQPWRAKQLAVGHRGALLRQARRVPGRAADDQPGGRRAGLDRGRPPPGRAGRSDHPRLPRLGQGRAHQLGDGGVGGRGAPAGPGLRRPAARGVARPARPARADRGVRTASTSPRRWPTPGRPAAGWPSTSSSASSWRWCCAAGPSSATPGPSATPSRPLDADPSAASGAGAAGPAWSSGSVAALPFELTGAQRRALAAIFADLAGPLPMHRLLQGDVGSGKTVVAVAAMLAAVQGGHQGALMVPTEVLAEQHFMAVRGSWPRAWRWRIPSGSAASARSPWHCSPTAPRRPSAPACTRAWPRDGRPRGGHPRPAHRRRALPLASGWW